MRNRQNPENSPDLHGKSGAKLVFSQAVCQLAGAAALRSGGEKLFSTTRERFPLDLIPFGLVLISALLHVCWNYFAKGSDDPPAMIWCVMTASPTPLGPAA